MLQPLHVFPLQCTRVSSARIRALHALYTCPAIRPHSAMPLVGQVALSLSFSRAVDSLASLVIQALQGGSGDTGKGAVDSKYNGVHLRIEKDAQDWSTTLGGQQVLQGVERWVCVGDRLTSDCGCMIGQK